MGSGCFAGIWHRDRSVQLLFSKFCQFRHLPTAIFRIPCVCSKFCRKMIFCRYSLDWEDCCPIETGKHALSRSLFPETQAAVFEASRGCTHLDGLLNGFCRGIVQSCSTRATVQHSINAMPDSSSNPQCFMNASTNLICPFATTGRKTG